MNDNGKDPVGSKDERVGRGGEEGEKEENRRRGTGNPIVSKGTEGFEGILVWDREDFVGERETTSLMKNKFTF